MAVRASLRRVLDHMTLAELAARELPEHVELLAAEYEADSSAAVANAPRSPGSTKTTLG